jgi:hypothetical protein
LGSGLRLDGSVLIYDARRYQGRENKTITLTEDQSAILEILLTRQPPQIREISTKHPNA